MKSIFTVIIVSLFIVLITAFGLPPKESNRIRLHQPYSLGDSTPSKFKLIKSDSLNKLDTLVIQGESLFELMRKFEKWFGVKVSYELGFNDKRISVAGQIRETESIQRILYALEDIKAFRFLIKKDTVFIKQYRN